MNDNLKNLKLLVTSGPTLERIDPVRFISNFSSGKQGYKIAEVFSKAFSEVTLVSGPTNISKPEGINVVDVESADQMLQACQKVLPVDVAIFAAAVSDWRVEEQSNQKLKKKSEIDQLQLSLVKNPDILKTISNHSMRPRLVIGFAAETENVIKNAQDKLKSKNCDWILANDVSSGVFGSDSNHVYFIDKTSVEDWGKSSKQDVAIKLLEKIRRFLP